MKVCGRRTAGRSGWKMQPPFLQTTEGQNNLDLAPAAEPTSGLNIEKGVLSHF